MDSSALEPIEIERKYRLSATEKVSMLAAIDDLKLEFAGEDFEENILFSNDELRSRFAVLRLRRIGERTVLTYKQKLESVGGAKRHVEHETEVADFDVAAAIFESLGYKRVLVYEKRRRKWNYRAVEIVVDELPFGDYMEIEGSLTSIAEAEMVLGAESLTVEHRTYPVLTTEFGVRSGDLFEARFSGPDLR